MTKILGLILLTLSLNSLAAGLKENEAYLILGIQGDNKDEVSKIRFEEYTTGKGISVQTRSSKRAKKVKAGNYYLERIIPEYANISPIIYNKPDNINNTFTIMPGTVTYIGTWEFNSTNNRTVSYWDISRDYSLEYLGSVAKRKKGATDYSLKMAIDNGELYDYQWVDIPGIE